MKPLFLFLLLLTYTSSFAVDIIPRSSWGADETLTYESHERWQTILASYAQNADKEPTARELEVQEMSTYVRENYPDYFTTRLVSRTENGESLATNIHEIDPKKIIVHHTASSYKNDTRTVSKILQDTFYFHNITRQWGDIGYNYIIDYDGNIYEGRKGGTTSKGIHTAWNNDNSIGISLMGNFEIEEPTREQLISLIELSDHVIRTENIDTTIRPYSFRECKWNCTEPIEAYETSWFIGHTHAGHTACPGKNLITYLPKIQRYLEGIHGGYEAEENDPFIHITEEDHDHDHDEIETEVAPISPVTEITDGNVQYNANLQSIENISDIIRIRLSYPDDQSSISFNKYKENTLKIQIGDKSVSVSGATITAQEDGRLQVQIGTRTANISNPIRIHGDIMEISSWDRVPAWDNDAVYNDNLFRNTVEIRNENGKLLVINELPVEDYVRGLGEVSESAHPEKIKTIITAARTYAYFYTSPYTRKFADKPYDGSDNPNEFQKYLGYSYELRSPTVTAMAEATEGNVITYNGDIIKAWYHNRTDGNTRSYKQYCELNGGTSCIDIPFFQSKVDPSENNIGHNAHGVGISGEGATAFANEGIKYDSILRYYLTGTRLTNI